MELWHPVINTAAVGNMVPQFHMTKSELRLLKIVNVENNVVLYVLCLLGDEK